MMMSPGELMEALADAEHASWARWMTYLFSRCEHRADGSCVIPADLVERWQRQVVTTYADLSERERASDRDEVRCILPLIERYARSRGLLSRDLAERLLAGLRAAETPAGHLAQKVGHERLGYCGTFRESERCVEHRALVAELEAALETVREGV